MAVTDEQLAQLKGWAEELGRDGVLPDPSDNDIIDAVFDRAELEGLRTEDEFDAIITPDDLPAPEDHADIVSAWERGNNAYNESEVQS